MGDLDKTATEFFNKTSTGGITPMAPAISGWQKLYNLIMAPSSVANASEKIPQENVPVTSESPVDPYANFANKATGLPYK